MEVRKIDEFLREKISKELLYVFSRSSGPGGQHVNKVNSRVTLKFDLDNSIAISEFQKQLIHSNLKNRISSEGFIILDSQDERSQYRNKKKVTDRFFELLENGLVYAKDRIPTKPSKASEQRRLDKKQRISHKKLNRRKPDEL